VVFVSAVILAAGESKRMGQPKLLMAWEGKTILEQTIDNCLNSKASETIIVLGYKARELSKVIGDRPVISVLNPAYHDGMSSSLIIGIKSTSPQTHGIMLVLADQPTIDSHTINKLIETFDKRQKNIVIPVYQGKRGHPVIFHVKYREELLNIRGDIGAREVIQHHADDVLEVAVDCKGVLIDIDTPSDFHNHLNKGVAS
jgi:molybdenum cofactor cytidylyltransferase